MKIGSPLDRDTSHGPQNHQAHLQKLVEYCQRGVKEGATLVCGGNQVPRPGQSALLATWASQDSGWHGLWGRHRRARLLGSSPQSGTSGMGGTLAIWTPTRSGVGLVRCGPGCPNISASLKLFPPMDPWSWISWFAYLWPSLLHGHSWLETPSPPVP